MNNARRNDMSRFTPTFVVALLVAYLLTACGGGDERASPASPQAMQSFNVLADYCGAGVTLPTTDTAQSMQQLGARTVTRDRVSYPVTTAYAVNGFSPIDSAPWPMPVPLDDLRGLTTGPYASRGMAYADVQMGVFVTPAFPSGGITCVMGVAGMRDNRDGTRTAVWATRDGALDLSGLPGSAINGFEWLANYAPAPGAAAFTMRKESIDPATARICVRATGAMDANTWACSVPAVSASETSYAFSLTPVVPGVYVVVGEKGVLVR